MSNNAKKIVSIIGIIVGVIIILIGGLSLQDTSVYTIGKQIKFGADFYTEIYDVTQDVGRAINYAINDLITAVSWLIISIGAIDVCFFIYKLVKACCEKSTNPYYMPNTEQSIYRSHYDSQTNIGEPNINLRRAIQCECGELYYGLYCPVCGKSAKSQNTTPQPSSVYVTAPQPVVAVKKSNICKCGERFYGDKCPNCGRNLNDL